MRFTATSRTPCHGLRARNFSITQQVLKSPSSDYPQFRRHCSSLRPPSRAPSSPLLSPLSLPTLLSLPPWKPPSPPLLPLHLHYLLLSPPDRAPPHPHNDFLSTPN
ncbi:hypothetical protein BDZ94DRAFT_1272663 [Collybia nuda]|uniref:Uncharacterized protein n=1 Tax=Collybia nuda TaxID=64659 RepID=A0A9P5XTY3_9AGAR|nr:hypothetical protein BDZ94DRAFT_1272663 [Collybia nuda]